VLVSAGNRAARPDTPRVGRATRSPPFSPKGSLGIR
jgi:hypothetical protein